MHFGIGRAITRTMKNNFRGMKIASRSIFISIVLAKAIMDSWGMFLRV